MNNIEIMRGEKMITIRVQERVKIGWVWQGWSRCRVSPLDHTGGECKIDGSAPPMGSGHDRGFT